MPDNAVTNELLDLIRAALAEHPDIADLKRQLVAQQQDARAVGTRLDQLERLLTADKSFRAEFERRTADALKELSEDVQENRRRTKEYMDAENEKMAAVLENVANVRTDLKDFQYRAGDALVTIWGRNPFLPGSTMIAEPLKARLERLDKSITDRHAELTAAMSQREARLDTVTAWVTAEERRRRERAEFIERVFSPVLVRVFNNPVVVRIIVGLVTMLTGLAGGTGLANILGGN